MTKSRAGGVSRRLFVAGAAAVAGQAAFAQTGNSTSTSTGSSTGTSTGNSTEIEGDISQTIRHNISSFRALDWQPYFSTLRKGAILCDIQSRALHFWNEDASIYKLYPTSVPLTDDLTRKGRTDVVQKVVAPPWRPTPSMRKSNPEWPAFVPGGDPTNPLGPLALYLGWQYYRIHGTQDTRKIGRRSSSGCIGLYNEHITELFGLASVGTQVLLI